MLPSPLRTIFASFTSVDRLLLADFQLLSQIACSISSPITVLLINCFLSI